MPVRLTSLTTTAGDTLVPSPRLTVIVGPNNVGKSVTLSELFQNITLMPGQPANTPKVIDSYDLQLPTFGEAEAILTAFSPLRQPGQHPSGTFHEPTYFARSNQNIAQSRVQALLSDPSSNRLGELASLFVVLFPPEGRLGQLGAQQVPDLLTQTPASPLQVLWANRALEATVSNYAKRAFGFDLTVSRHAGANARLHIGRPVGEEPPIGVMNDYVRELLRVPEVSAQGHGVQAFLGIVVTLATSTYDVVLIDEPEAFLHPPQARLLGEILVELSRGGSQVVVATHSDDFLQGALRAAGSSTAVTLARLTRPEPNRNALTQVSPEEVKKLYDDPLLRYSHIMSGIFYRGTVLCEAESDCKYYSAVLDSKYADAEAAVHRPDLLFAQCGGKDRFTKAVTALQSMTVPTAVIADIDMLADEAQFKRLFEQLGGDWKTVSIKYRVLREAIDSKTHAPERTTAKVVVDEVFAASTARALTRDETDKIRDATKAVTGWSQLKETGTPVVPSGPPATALSDVFAACKAIGLFLVEEGELEGWHRQFARANKQAWLRQVFEAGAYAASAAAPMLDEVVAFIEARQ